MALFFFLSSFSSPPPPPGHTLSFPLYWPALESRSTAIEANSKNLDARRFKDGIRKITCLREWPPETGCVFMMEKSDLGETVAMKETPKQVGISPLDVPESRATLTALLEFLLKCPPGVPCMRQPGDN